jgi:hypothetical protein
MCVLSVLRCAVVQGRGVPLKKEDFWAGVWVVYPVELKKVGEGGR